MTALQHVYVTAHGHWDQAPWQDETAQIGLRLACVNDGNVPAKGVPFTIFGGNGDVTADGGTESGTHGTLARAWTARMGEAGSIYNMDAARQVDIAEDIWKFLDAIKAHVCAHFLWTHVKVAPIHADGKYGFTGAATYNFTAPLAGGFLDVPLPPEVAVAISLRAPIAGRTGRGRMFIPGVTTPTVDTPGTVKATVRTLFANSAATLLADLDDAPGVDEWGNIVMVTSAGKATAVRPSQVRVGDHFDAQRRRQHQAIETYTTVGL